MSGEAPRCEGCGFRHEEPCRLCPSGLCSAHQPVEGAVANLFRDLHAAVTLLLLAFEGKLDVPATQEFLRDMNGYVFFRNEGEIVARSYYWPGVSQTASSSGAQTVITIGEQSADSKETTK